MRIGVVRYWADRPVAEHEVIARLRGAAAARSHVLVELNPDGSSLEAVATTPQVDMVLNLHYLSPKAIDVPHVGLLWNPMDFYHNFGFVPHFANQVSHDYLATAGSRVVEAAFAPLRPDLFAGPLPVLNHTVPQRYLPPRTRADRKVFYVGVNWERVIGQGGRHSDLLGRLDDDGLSEIYGPRKIESFVPWEGYQTYRGDLPFDGWSVIEAIARAGSALVVSSPAHYRDGVMSCRPFEAAAAGVPLISERHPFMLEHFADAAVFFDERASVAEQAAEITQIVAALNDDPERAVALAQRAQDVVRDRFNLDQQLDDLCRWVTTAEAARTRPEVVEATAVVVPIVDADEFVVWARRHGPALARFTRTVVAPRTRSKEWTEALSASGLEAELVVGTRPDTGWSERVAQAVSSVDGTVCFLTATEQLFAGYPDAVARAGRSGVGVVPAVTAPARTASTVNESYPRLVSAGVTDWWGLPVASVVVTATALKQVQALFGPGAHLGVLAEMALEARDGEVPDFVPALGLVPDADGHQEWDVGSLVGAERHRDASYARALPAAMTDALPAGLLVREVGTPQFGLSTRLAGALRRTALPAPVSEAIITVSRRVLKPRRTPK